MLFFSGGTALRGVSRVLTQYTHNSTHLITPFDSGGSSAKLRDAFGMISVGDLRNRLMALADMRLRGPPRDLRLFGYRFPADADGRPSSAAARDDAPGRGTRSSTPSRTRCAASSAGHLAFFADGRLADFDLRGASIGNLILTGGYLNQARDIDAVTFTFSKLVEARGLVRPVVDADCHLRAVLEDGRVVIGQHRLTGKEVAPLDVADRRHRPRLGGDPDAPAEVDIDRGTRRFIDDAELICFPFGELLHERARVRAPRGMGRAVAEAGCPRCTCRTPSRTPSSSACPWPAPSSACSPTSGGAVRANCRPSVSSTW